MSIIDSIAEKLPSDGEDVTIASRTQPWPGLTGKLHPIAGSRREKLPRLGQTGRQGCGHHWWRQWNRPGGGHCVLASE